MLRLIALTIFCLLPHPLTAGEPPNIVLLLADDLGWTGLGCFGSDFYETPHLDRLAEQGMKFTNAYAACTVCSPTRASIMTGKYPARLHLTDFIPGQKQPHAKLQIPDWHKGLRHDEITVAEVLRDHGYQTGMVGKWHLDRPGQSAEDAPVRHGFAVQHLRPPGTKGYQLPKKVQQQTGRTFLTDYLTDRAMEFIDEASEDSKPFLLYMSYNVPHTPIQGREDLVAHFKAKVNPKAVHHNPVYAAMVASLDNSVGRILQQLDALGETQNTLVVFTSDNGGLTQRYGKHDGFTENLPLRRGKGSAFEGGVRVPAIVRWPAVVAAGSVSDTPVMTIDYFPTFLAAAGVTVDRIKVDGVNLVPVFRDAQTKFDRDLFWHYPHYHAGGDGPYSAIRSGEYRLIESLETDQLALYDLNKDIGETANLAESLPAVRDQLHHRLKAWRTNVGAQMPTMNPEFNPAKTGAPRR